jgi:hypothetical protein
VTAADVVDRTADVFADILCADSEWVDAEFEQIVSGFWDEPTSTASPPRSPSVANRPESTRTHEPVSDQWCAETYATIRSPPSEPARTPGRTEPWKGTRTARQHPPGASP